MAIADFTIRWDTRPCVVRCDNAKTTKGFWHMWHEPKNGVYIGKVVGIVESEFGTIYMAKCEDIVFLDAEEKFSGYDWELAEARACQRSKELERKYGYE